MNKTKIEWCDYTINPVKGLCPMACSYCYARAMYKRFKWNPDIQWDEQCLIDLKQIKQPSRIFIGSTMELFGDWVGDSAIEYIFDYLKDYPQHTFIFLTKQPQNLSKWSPFPDNVWVGVSATDNRMLYKACEKLDFIKAGVRFISIEPLLERFDMDTDEMRGYITNPQKGEPVIDWIIIGQQTPSSTKTSPKKEWVDEIVDAADKAGIPVFLKNNLRPILKNVYGDSLPLRQEFPAASRIIY